MAPPEPPCWSLQSKPPWIHPNQLLGSTCPAKRAGPKRSPKHPPHMAKASHQTHHHTSLGHTDARKPFLHPPQSLLERVSPTIGHVHQDLCPRLRPWSSKHWNYCYATLTSNSYNPLISTHITSFVAPPRWTPLSPVELCTTSETREAHRRSSDQVRRGTDPARPRLLRRERGHEEPTNPLGSGTSQKKWRSKHW